MAILQQILFYRERGLELKTVQKIIYDKDFDMLEAMEEHLLELEKQKAETEALIRTVKKTIQSMKGECEMSDKEKNVVTIMEVCNEMYARGIKFLPVDLYKSHSFRFIPTEEGLIPPLNALPNLGTNAAKAIVEARDEESFSSIEDLQQRSKVFYLQ